jgi:hypothetical protein
MNGRISNDEMSNSSRKVKEAAVYSTLCYFDIFDHPLKYYEVYLYCQEKVTETELATLLKKLILARKIACSQGHYFLHSKGEHLVKQRYEKEMYLKSQLGTIKKYAFLIGRFPFVEQCFISGSVSKGVLQKNGDVDFFIIAKKNRVWLCRTLLVLFKKIVLLNSNKYFCVNYFVGTDNLVINDRNIFVATEIQSLIPIGSKGVINDFIFSNAWVTDFLPNATLSFQRLFNDECRPQIISAIIEFLCNNAFGDYLDNLLFRATYWYWKKKFKGLCKEEFNLNMRSSKNVSKHHPKGYQYKVLELLDRNKNLHTNSSL